MAKDDLVYRGLRPEEYQKFKETGILVPDGRSVNERAGKGISFFESKDQALLHAGSEGRVVGVNKASMKWNPLGAGGEAAFANLGNGLLSDGPVKASSIIDDFGASDHYDEAIERLHTKKHVPIQSGDYITPRNNRKHKIDTAHPADSRHAGEVIGKSSQGHQWFEPRNLLSEDDLRASQERLRIKRMPHTSKTPLSKPVVPKVQPVNTIPSTPKVPETKRIPKKSEVPMVPKVKPVERVSGPKPPPMIPKTKPQGTTPATVSGEIDKVTVKEVMDEKQKATTGKVATEVDRAETKQVLDGGRPKGTHGDGVKAGVESTVNDARVVTTRKAEMVTLSKARTAGRIGLLLFGAGVVADISNRLADDRQEKRQTMKQDEDLRKKDRLDKKDMNKMFGYNTMDYSNIVQEMWNNRTGHYKMGNSKFQ